MGKVTRISAPIMIFLCYLVAGILTLVVMIAIDRRVGYLTLFGKGDINAALIGSMWVFVMVYGVSRLYRTWECVSKFSVLTHLRHCCLLYASFALGTFGVIVEVSSDRLEMAPQGMIVASVVAVTALVGIVTNFGVLANADAHA